jgi:hypothetical protein
VSYSNELEMYPDVAAWLCQRLAGRYPGAQLEVHDTHAMPLHQYILRNGLHHYFATDIWHTYDIHVDVTAFLKYRGGAGLAFVECKNTSITLRDLSQLLGYARVALPLHAYLVSPLGVGTAIRSLLLTHDRTDILEYHWPRGQQPRAIVVGTFNRLIKGIDLGSVLPRGIE